MQPEPHPRPHLTPHAHLNTLQYITHWIPTCKLVQQNNIKKPFIKLRKFTQQSLARKHEQTINNIMIQRLYLIAVALINGVELKLSNQYYCDHKTGFIYGIYQFRQQGQEDIAEKMGVKMGRDVGMTGTDCFYDCIENYVQDYCDLIDRLNFNIKGQYQDFVQNFRKIFYANAQKSQNISPQQFLSLFEHWPIAEHYVFKIKLKNSFILPTIIEHVSLSTQLRELQKIQKQYLPQLIQKCQGKSETIAKIMLEFQDKIQKIFKQLEKEGKIIQPKINATKPIIKQINKDYKELKIVCDFLVLLSPSRSQVIINERPIEEGFPQSPSSKTIKKITIMPLNGSMAPISGNVLSINWTWQFSLVPIPFISSKVQCFNNRKVQQTYFEQFKNFWYCLQSTPSFQDIIGSDKYTISLNSKSKMEILFANHIPSIALSQIFKQIDKIIGLTITMDSVVELCQRKGTENQDPEEYPIQKFLQEQAIGKFQRVLATVNANWKNLIKY